MAFSIYLGNYEIIGGPSAPVAFYVYNEAYCVCQAKTWYGSWGYDSGVTECTFSGNWLISVFYYPQTYSGNFYFYNKYANNVKCSINPQGGSSAPYRSYFEIEPNNANYTTPGYIDQADNYQPYFLNYYWQAHREGGCCGVNVILAN